MRDRRIAAAEQLRDGRDPSVVPVSRTNGGTESFGSESVRPDGSPVEPGLRGADHGVFGDVLGEATEALENAGVPYALIGGIASNGFGRPRWTHDIDVFVPLREDYRHLLDWMKEEAG